MHQVTSVLHVDGSNILTGDGEMWELMAAVALKQLVSYQRFNCLIISVNGDGLFCMIIIRSILFCGRGSRRAPGKQADTNPSHTWSQMKINPGILLHVAVNRVSAALPLNARKAWQTRDCRGSGTTSGWVAFHNCNTINTIGVLLFSLSPKLKLTEHPMPLPLGVI